MFGRSYFCDAPSSIVWLFATCQPKPWVREADALAGAYVAGGSGQHYVSHGAAVCVCLTMRGRRHVHLSYVTTVLHSVTLHHLPPRTSRTSYFVGPILHDAFTTPYDALRRFSRQKRQYRHDQLRLTDLFFPDSCLDCICISTCDRHLSTHNAFLGGFSV